MTTVRMADLPTTDTDVLVVGAGPTGLMAGLVLTRRGVPVVVVDQKGGPTRESRALAVQARTMEIYDQLGLADHVLSGAYPALRIGLPAWIDGPHHFPADQKGRLQAGRLYLIRPARPAGDSGNARAWNSSRDRAAWIEWRMRW